MENNVYMITHNIFLITMGIFLYRQCDSQPEAELLPEIRKDKENRIVKSRKRVLEKSSTPGV